MPTYFPDRLLGDLGDIDVLCTLPSQRRILVIECKAFAVARLPHELAHEAARLFQGQGKTPSTVAKHERRVAWIREHTAAVASWLGLDSATPWAVDGLIVVDRELLTPYLHRAALPVVSLEEFKATFVPVR